MFYNIRHLVEDEPVTPAALVDVVLDLVHVGVALEVTVHTEAQELETQPGLNVIKPFTSVIYACSLSLAGLSSLVICLWVRPGAYPRVEHLKDASLG